MELSKALNEIIGLAIKQVSTMQPSEMNFVIKNIYSIQAEIEKILNDSQGPSVEKDV